MARPRPYTARWGENSGSVTGFAFLAVGIARTAPRDRSRAAFPGGGVRPREAHRFDARVGEALDEVRDEPIAHQAELRRPRRGVAAHPQHAGVQVDGLGVLGDRLATTSGQETKSSERETASVQPRSRSISPRDRLRERGSRPGAKGSSAGSVGPCRRRARRRAPSPKTSRKRRKTATCSRARLVGIGVALRLGRFAPSLRDRLGIGP